MACSETEHPVLDNGTTCHAAFHQNSMTTCYLSGFYFQTHSSLVWVPKERRFVDTKEHISQAVQSTSQHWRETPSTDTYQGKITPQTPVLSCSTKDKGHHNLNISCLMHGAAEKKISCFKIHSCLQTFGVKESQNSNWTHTAWHTAMHGIRSAFTSLVVPLHICKQEPQISW